MKRSFREVLGMTGGRTSWNGSDKLRIWGVSTDSRTIGADQLFVPLAGEHYDGHQYVQQALSKGAAAALWQQDHGEPPAGPVIVVEDTLAALQRLASEYRKQLSVRIAGITGSNGKTTTKDMLAAMLATTYKVHKTEGNLNNHIGLPLTLLQIEEDTEMAVIEMGMSGRGEIELLSKLAQPEVAIITNIGEAHLEQLGSRDEIAKAKLEILSGLRGNGLFVYPGEEPLIQKYLPEAAKPEIMLRMTFGEGKPNDLYPLIVLQDTEGTHFTLNSAPRVNFFMSIFGRHNVQNAAAAFAAAKYLGAGEAAIFRALKELQPTQMRIEKLQGVSGLTILNDAYNASPTSMKAAIQLMYDMKIYSKRYLVLGDMLELGPNGPAYHEEIGRMMESRNIHAVYGVGELTRHLVKAAATKLPDGCALWFESKKELCEALIPELRPEDAVLVKASRGMKMEEVVEQLMKAYL